MRTFQLALFVLGAAAFLVSLAFAGGWIGDTLWRAGIALMVTDLVVMRLWPALKSRGAV
jgi:hypothetical protein